MVQIFYCLMLVWGLVMAKYTTQDIKALAMEMRIAKDEKRPFAVLTGAGCSVTAGIPLAPGIVEYIDKLNYGKLVAQRLGCDSLVGRDYGEVMGKLLHSEVKTILEKILSDAKVNWGHIALASLMKAGYVGRVLTFNFDSILAQAAGISGLYPATYDFGVSPATTFKHIVTPSVLHLHGQGHGLVQMNSTEDTEKHGKRLLPLFQDTLKQFDILIVGYGAKSDKAFPYFKEGFEGERRLTWCEYSDGVTPSHVEELKQKAPQATTFLQGVDFDSFMIELAQELGEFPPLLFEDTAQHVLNDIEPIVRPPDDLRGAIGLLPDLRAKLKKWQVILKEQTPSEKLRTAMLKRDWDTAISLKDEVVTPQDKDAIAWACVKQGDAISDLAELKQDEDLFHQSFVKYDAALRIKPDMLGALNNWGNALSRLAEMKKDEELLHQSFLKYDSALKIKPGLHQALNNWGSGLLTLAKQKQDEELFHQSIAKFDAALKTKPDMHEALFNWGTALSLLGEMKKDEALFRQSLEKYEAALKIKPDKDQALDNWSTAVLHLYRLTGDKSLLPQAEDLARRAEQITGKATYNLACVYSLQIRGDKCRDQLVKCKAEGRLPSKQHLLGDADLESARDEDWFKAFIADLP